MLAFEYPEDKAYFAALLAGGDEAVLEAEFAELFDFRDPDEKRTEFNRMRPHILPEIIDTCKTACQLRIHPDCSSTGAWHIDHIIPLSSAMLQRKLRNMKNNPDGTKPKSLSYGSNNRKNLTLACDACNQRKKHLIIWPVPSSADAWERLHAEG